MKEEAKASTRRSARNYGKDLNYNVEMILDAADKADGASSRNGSINLMLAKNYDPDLVDPKGWFMSEKMDGVRCYWDGKAMYTRNGNPFYPPDSWKKELPNFPLDGELWTKRNDF